VDIFGSTPQSPKQSTSGEALEVEGSEGRNISELEHEANDKLTARWEGAFLEESSRWASSMTQSSNITQRKLVNRAKTSGPATLIPNRRSALSTRNRDIMRREIEEEVRAEICSNLRRNHVKWAFAQLGVDVEDLLQWDGLGDRPGECYLQCIRVMLAYI
jgi:hypothetical protein